MKKKYIVLGAFVFISSVTRAHQNDSLFKKDTIKKTDMEIMYSHYMQDGNNSAVTGGIGTEKLMVYSPSFKISTKGYNRRITALKGGADIISSASTDRIDYVVSSASKVDVRSYGNLNHSVPMKNGRTFINAGTGFSVESDYFSLPFSLGMVRTSKNKMRTCNLDLQVYLDDLRWGRINENYYRPVKLIYPSELRTTQWYSIYKRQSYNLKTGIQQVLNKRNRVSIFPEITLQQGLLATPFHRVYFKDSSLRVEKLPEQRIKLLLGLKLNSFVGGRTILKNAIDFYADDFGILAIGIENETAIKINYQFTLSPFIRIYKQKGSKYFAPYKQHEITDAFYTSDYDLSSFNTYKVGLNIRYAPFRYIRKNLMFNEMQFRYAFYYRSNGLQAHMVSCVFNGLLINRK